MGVSGAISSASRCIPPVTEARAALALILGIAAVVLVWPLGILLRPAAFWVGISAVRRINRAPGVLGAGRARTGVIIGAVVSGTLIAKWHQEDPLHEATAWGAFLKLAQATFSSAQVDRYGHQRCPRSQPTSSPVVGMASADNRHPDRFDPDPPEPGHRRVPRVRYKCINLNSAGRNIALAQDNGAPLACGSAEFGFWSGAGDTI